MSFYKIKNKIIYRKYRMIRKIIWSIEYIDSQSFKANITMLIGIVNSYVFTIYGIYHNLLLLNDYYADMCIDEMKKRVKLEKSEVL